MAVAPPLVIAEHGNAKTDPDGCDSETMQGPSKRGADSKELIGSERSIDLISVSSELVL